MSGFLDSVRSTSEFVNASRSAYDNDGAAPTQGILSKAIDDMSDFFHAAGSVSVKDAPAYLDAIRNLNGIGIDDREYLVCAFFALAFLHT
jgi:linoleate 10R-lipoxygenase